MLTVMMAFFVTLSALAVPVAVALGIGSVAGLVLTTDLSLMVVVQRMAAQLDSFVLLAIPLFVLAGSLMNAGGITERLMLLSSALVGHMVGGLAQVNVVLSVLFGGLSGSGTADAAAEAKMLNPIMVRAGYSPAFAGAVTSVSAIVAPIIPPSIPMIIYCGLTDASVGRLFIAGIIPGIFLALGMSMVVHRISLKRGYGREHSRATFKQMVFAVRQSVWALLMPVIIIGGIRFGVFTPTEAAGVAVIYAFLVGMFIHRHLKLSMLPRILSETTRDTGVVLLIIAAAAPFAWILTQARVPQKIAELVTSVTTNPILFLIIVNVFLLFLGCLMEGTALMVVLVPVIAPIAFALGVDPIHFGIVVVVNIMIGSITPPFGQIVFITSVITKVPAEKIFREAMPFIWPILGTLLILTYMPGTYMWLVNLIGP